MNSVHMALSNFALVIIAPPLEKATPVAYIYIYYDLHNLVRRSFPTIIVI